MDNLNPALLTTILWIVLISIVGMLPMRFHWRLGLPMLLLFPAVVIWLGQSMGLWWAVALMAGALSIYRYPARYYSRKLWAVARCKPGN